jgi:hypothetical protein
MRRCALAKSYAMGYLPLDRCSAPLWSQRRASPIGVRSYGHERGAGLSAVPNPSVTPGSEVHI